MITVEKICQMLNDLVAIDCAATHMLVEYRVLCNDAIEDHPLLVPHAENPSPIFLELGLLGIINGICNMDGTQRIAAQFEKERLTGFAVIPWPSQSCTTPEGT